MSWQSKVLPEAEEALASIAEVRAETGVSARTLRYYEELGLLPGVRRRASGRRVYGPDEIERLRFIQRLKRLGLSLAEVKALNAVYAIGGSTHDMLLRLEEQLDAHAASIQARIRELARAPVRAPLDALGDRERLEQPDPVVLDQEDVSVDACFHDGSADGLAICEYWTYEYYYYYEKKK